MHRKKTLVILIIALSLACLLLSLRSAQALVHTRYMRAFDSHTVNGLTADKLGTSQTASDDDNVGSNVFTTVYYGIRVWRRLANTTEVEITSGTPVAQVSKVSGGEEIKSNTWACPETALSTTDSIVVRIYRKWGGSWSNIEIFTTEQLGSQELESATWTVYYSLRIATGEPYYWYYYYWGTPARNSRIENFAYSPPVNDSLDLTDPSIGTQGVLSQKQAYTFQVKVTENDGGSNINYVEMTLDYGGQNLKFRWTQSSDTFSEESDPEGYVSISSTSGDSSLSGNQWTLDFKITFDWDYPDESLHDVRIYSLDDDGLSDTDDYSNIYYVENDLESYSLNVDDTRCNPAVTLTFSGYLRYQGTSSINPNNGNYEVTVRLSGVQKGTIDQTLVSGQFSINDVPAESSVASYSYTVEFSYMTGAGSFSAVVVDRIEIWLQALNHSRVNINEAVEYRVKARLDYDNHALGSGDSLTANIGSLTWDAGNSWFDGTKTESTASDYTFQVSSGSEATYGITSIDVGVSNPQGIWDRLSLTYSANTTTPVAGDGVNITVTATYEYDSSSASFWYVNSQRNSTYFANTETFTDSSEGEVFYQYTAINASDDGFNITALTTNTLTVEWGGLFVEVYEISSSSRVTVSSVGYAYYHMRWSSNLTDVDTGTLTVNGTGYSINATGWATANSTESSVGLWEFWVTAMNVNGETDWEQVPSNATVIWDKGIIALSSNSPVDIGNPATINWTVSTSYDSQTISSFLINITRAGELVLTNSPNSSMTDTFSKAHSAVYTATGVTDNDYSLTAFDTNYITVEWKSERSVTGGGTGVSPFVVTAQAVGVAIQTELAQRGLWWLGGFLGIIFIGGIVSASQKKRVSRKKPTGHVSQKKSRLKGASKARGRQPRGHRGGAGKSPRGKTGKQRDKSGRFK